jgi:hypothetical protein
MVLKAYSLTINQEPTSNPCLYKIACRLASIVKYSLKVASRLLSFLVHLWL